jgi:dTDP-4-amino-4,6-dideoxygalactose transaminase
MKIIPYGKQSINDNDIKSVLAALKNDIITTGSTVTKFENALCNYFSAKYVSVCNSGTSALFLAMLAIGLKKNDKIIMPAINFVASYNVAKHLGAKIFLADVDKHTGQMRPEDILNCCKKFKLKKIKAIVTMYNGGYPENVKNFKNLKKKLKCLIIEDACHAFGAEYRLNNKDYKVGCCKHADISTFSLHPLKTITTGEGGVISTNLKNIDKKVKEFRSLGIIKNKRKHWDYEVLCKGFNLRMNDFQCALGLSQLKRVKLFINQRKKIAFRYDKELTNFKNILIPSYTKKNKPSYHLYLINLKNFSNKKKDLFIKYMRKKKIILQYHYIPIYKFKIFNERYIGKNAEKYYKETVSLPIYYDLKNKEQTHIINSIRLFFKNK